MAEGEIGGFLGKTTGSLPNWAWGLVIVAGAGVGYLFVRSRNASAANAPVATQDTTGQGASTPTGVGYSGPAGGQQSPVMTVPGGSSGQVPILPPGYTPIYDNNGNLIGWEPSPGNQPPPTQKVPIYSNSPITGASGTAPLIPYGQMPSGNFVSGSQLTYGGQVYTTIVGPGGRLWGVPGIMSAQAANMIAQKVLLYAPPTYYH